jgi:ATP-dependent Clp protease ATP-binding subunit ClpA
VRAGHLPFGRRAKKALELSLREAVRLKHREIATGHLLLGLLREGQGLAATIIAGAGIDPAELRAEVTRLLSAEAA